ncbi:MAG: tetratricopeptide repeat protein [Spirochaetota bacterium]
MKKASIIVFAGLCLALPAHSFSQQELPPAGETESSSSLEQVNDDVRYDNAYRLLSLKKKDKALALFGEYLELFPEGAHRKEALRYIGDIYLDRFDYKKALKYYQSLYEEFSGEDEGIAGYFQTGICYSRMGNNAKAVEIYKDIMELYPASPYMQKAKIQLDLEEMIK